MTTTKHTNDTKRASDAPPSPRWGAGRREVLSVAALLLLAASLIGLAGRGMLDRAYTKQVTWTNAPVVHVLANTVVCMTPPFD